MLKVEANFWEASTPFLTDNNKPMKRNWIKLNPTKGRVHSRLELEFLNSIFNATLVLSFEKNMSTNLIRYLLPFNTF